VVVHKADTEINTLANRKSFKPLYVSASYGVPVTVLTADNADPFVRIERLHYTSHAVSALG
jgi:hypothetical protein